MILKFSSKVILLVSSKSQNQLKQFIADLQQAEEKERNVLWFLVTLHFKTK